MRTLLVLNVKLPEECGPTPVQPSVLFFWLVPDCSRSSHLASGLPFTMIQFRSRWKNPLLEESSPMAAPRLLDNCSLESRWKAPASTSSSSNCLPLGVEFS